MYNFNLSIIFFKVENDSRVKIRVPVARLSPHPDAHAILLFPDTRRHSSAEALPGSDTPSGSGSRRREGSGLEGWRGRGSGTEETEKEREARSVTVFPKSRGSASCFVIQTGPPKNV